LADAYATHLLVKLGSGGIRIIQVKLYELLVDFVIDLPLQALDDQSLLPTLFLKFVTAARHERNAIILAVLYGASVVLVALLARQLGETVLVFVMCELVAAYSNLLALIAEDLLMGAAFLFVLQDMSFVDSLTT